VFIHDFFCYREGFCPPLLIIKIGFIRLHKSTTKFQFAKYHAVLNNQKFLFVINISCQLVTAAIIVYYLAQCITSRRWTNKLEPRVRCWWSKCHRTQLSPGTLKNVSYYLKPQFHKFVR